MQGCNHVTEDPVKDIGQCPLNSYVTSSLRVLPLRTVFPAAARSIDSWSLPAGYMCNPQATIGRKPRKIVVWMLGGE